ncbi:MAG: hypothetical protein R2788_14550 [Saprospiraceae bacterium]
MKIVKIIFLFTLISIFGCNGQSNQSSEKSNGIEYEIQQLETADSKKAYLEQILADDQAVRNGEISAELMLKYGKDSEEYMEYVKAQWDQDEINLHKIETYLEEYGYPKKDELGKDVAIAPWLVIHHSTDTGIRNRNFEILYKAYLSGDIDDTAMSMYLGRTYEFTFKERFRMENPYKSEDEINQLIEKLNLEEEKANALQSAKRS